MAVVGRRPPKLQDPPCLVKLSFETDKVGSENLANSCICLRHVGLAWQFTGDASKSRAAARDWEFLQAKRQGWECAQGRGSTAATLHDRLAGGGRQGGSKISSQVSEGQLCPSIFDNLRCLDNQLHSK